MNTTSNHKGGHIVFFLSAVLPVLMIGGLLFAPTITLAQLGSAQTNTAGQGVYSTCSTGINDLTDIIAWPVCVINKFVIPLLVTLALVVFMWGIIKYIAQPTDAAFRKNITSYMGWAIIAIFVMLSVWGIVYVIGSTLQIGQGGVGPVPTLYQGS